MANIRRTNVLTAACCEPSHSGGHLLELCIAALVVVVITSACALFMVLASL
jgi:hypothetical protein